MLTPAECSIAELAFVFLFGCERRFSTWRGWSGGGRENGHGCGWHWKEFVTAKVEWQRLWSMRVMATRVALAFGLTCVRLFSNGVNHSLNLDYGSLVLPDQPTDGLCA